MTPLGPEEELRRLARVNLAATTVHGDRRRGLHRLKTEDRLDQRLIAPRFWRCFRPANKARLCYPSLVPLRDWVDALADIARLTPSSFPRLSARPPIPVTDDQRAAVFELLERLLTEALTDPAGVAPPALSPFGRAIGLLTILVAELLNPPRATPPRAAPALQIPPDVRSAFGANTAGEVPGALAVELIELYADANGEQRHVTPTHLFWLFEAIRLVQPGVVERCPDGVRTGFRTFVQLRRGEVCELGNPSLFLQYCLWKLRPDLDRSRPGGAPATDPAVIAGQPPVGGADRLAVRLTGRPGAGRLVRALALAAVCASAVTAGVLGWRAADRFAAEQTQPLEGPITGRAR